MSNDTVNEQTQTVEHFFSHYPDSVVMERLKELLLDALRLDQTKE